MSGFVLDDDSVNESLLIHELAHAMRICFDRRVQHLGLTRSQWRVLAILRRQPGIRQTQLAECMEIEPITLARLLDRMEKAGWTERRPDPEDRRAKQVYVTDKAQGILKEIRKIAVATRSDALKGFSAGDHAVLLNYLKRLKNNMADMMNQPPGTRT